MRFQHVSLAVLAAALVLSGCASKEPMDYLPRGIVYGSVNMERARSEPNAKRILEAISKLSVSGATSSQDFSRAYFSVGDPRANGGFAACFIGSNSLAETVFAAAKAEGATPTKLRGFEAMKLPPSSYLAKLSPDALLVADSEATFDKMLQTAKKKQPNARSDAAFTKLVSLHETYPISVVANTAEIAGQASQAMQASPIGKSAPQAVQAVQNISLISLTADWAEQPKVQLTAYTQSQEDAKVLAGLLQLAMVMQGSQLPPMLKNLTPTTSPEGLVLALEIPKDKAEKFVSELEKMGKNLPSDPEKRKAEIQRRMMTAFR